MNLIDKRTTSVLFTILAFVGLPALAYLARRPVIAITFAVLFAYVLEPVVARFQGWLHGSRALGVAATYVLLGSVVTIFLITAGPRIFREGQHLNEQLPTLMENVGSGQIAQQFGSRRGWDVQTQIRVHDFLSIHRETIAQYSRALGNRATELAGNVIWLLLIPLLAVFFLKGKSHFADMSVELIDDPRQRRFLRAVLDDLDSMLAAFIRAQLSLAALSLAAYTVFLLIIRFPYAFAIGALAGIFEFIPMVGALLTAVLILGMAVLTGYPHWLVIVVFLLIWRGIQDYVSSPYLMGRGLELHPLAVIFGVLCGGQIGGLIGVFLSVPLMGAFRIIWKNWRLEAATRSGGECRR